MAIVTWRGVRLDSQTAEMMREVDKLIGPDIPVRPTQGSYSNGSQSAGTHSGGGAIDISVRTLTDFQENLLVFLLRRVGFAAWHRSASEGNWAEHVHAINKTCPDLSPSAKRQVEAYKAGLSGLASGKRDKHAGLEAPRNATWKSYLANWPDAK